MSVTKLIDKALVRYCTPTGPISLEKISSCFIVCVKTAYVAMTCMDVELVLPMGELEHRQDILLRQVRFDCWRYSHV